MLWKHSNIWLPWWRKSLFIFPFAIFGNLINCETKIMEIVNQDPDLFLPVIFLQNWMIKFFKTSLKLVLYFAYSNLVSSNETPFDWSQLRIIHVLIKFYYTSKTYLGYSEPKLHIFNWNVLRNWSLKS